MTVIDEYLNKLDPDEKVLLGQVRQIIKRILPDAEEAISYGIPAFELNGSYIIGFAAFKNHLSLFPTGGPVEALQAKLQDFKLSKGTIQFSAENPIPKSVIKQLIEHRLAALNG